ncbi:MAG: hypothetical protein GWN00_10360, partial [Aliifodinibius sp.]|nr:hypothetical protein [Fodinibius sp.]NIW44593.1 hypothetical protein [Gammaproteobacteria bacterium]NIX02734.1 hypothetical protein [Phycisphaerae bacterium]NIY25192.1 hypothetical protein [Fodinibius sp.]
MSNEESQKGIVVSQIFSGVGIGLLLGIIVGLSVSPVVKTILGSLAGLLAAFLGLQDSFFSKQGEEDFSKVQSRIKMSGIRAGSFGLFCVIGILLGIVLRTHEVLTISVKEQVQRWVEAGYDSSYARNLVVYQRLRIQPDSAGFKIDPQLAATTIDAASGFLFTKKEMQNYCVSLSVSKYNDSVDNTLEAYDGMKPEIRELAANIRKVPEPHRATIINSVVDLICYLGDSEMKLEDFCESLKKNINYNDIEQTLADLTSSDTYDLAMLANNILTYVPDEQDKS